MRKRYNILFYIANNYLRCQVRFDGKKATFNVGYKTDPTKWSPETQRCVRNTYHFGVPAAEINEAIMTFEDAITEHVKHQDATIDTLKNAVAELQGKGSRFDGSNVQDLSEKFMIEVSQLHSWSAGTIKKWKTIRKRLASAHIDNISQFSEETLTDYVRNLIADEMNNTSIRREIKFLFTFLRWCKKRKFYDGDVYENFDARFKIADNVVIYLSWDELKKLYDFDFGAKYNLAHVRDVFCFQCFTSLRYSDVKQLKKKNITDKINVVTQKTSELVTIELNDYSREILERYKDNPSEFALPVISNQKMNKDLKIIGEMVGFDENITKVWYSGGKRHETTYKKYELLTTHCGRRTFVVNALYLGIPERVVRSWTGHADSRSMNPYVALVEELKANEMAKFNK